MEGINGIIKSFNFIVKDSRRMFPKMKKDHGGTEGLLVDS